MKFDLKKILIIGSVILALLLVIVGVAFVSSSCNDGGDSTTTTTTTTTTVKKPTTTTATTTTTKPQEDDSYPHVHTLVIDSEVPATCTKTGITAGVHCSECAEVLIEQVEIPMADHVESDWIVDSAAQCTVDGSRHTECTACGALIKSEGILQTGHVESEWVIDKTAGIIECGSKHTECNICGEVIATGSIPKLSLSISFLGDSITTYEGYSNNTRYNSTIGNNAVFYNSSKLNVNDSYWKRTVDELELDLIVNNSWSGSWCTGSGVSSGCGTRPTQLHNNSGDEPDIIVVYIGINDFNAGTAVGAYNNVNDIYNPQTKTYIGDTSKFAQAYAMMIHKIKQRYPEADIYVCNLLPNNRNTNYTLLNTYNVYIERIANEFGCTLVDFYNDSGINQNNFTAYMLDGLHPNVKGNELMANCVKNAIINNYPSATADQED